MKIFLPLLVALVSVPGFADPLDGSYTVGNSIAGNYSARGIFSNPASLPFETLLNGPGLNSSLTWAVNRQQEDGGSLGISLGNFGFGFERLAFSNGQKLNRYHFGGGFPVGDRLFVGARATLHRSDSLPEYTGLGLGIQYRLHPMVALGLVVNDLNRPAVGGGKEAPTRWIAGLLTRPFSFLDVSFDVDTLSGSGNTFGKQFGYQAHGHFTVTRGVRVTVGYHDTYEFQAGLRIDLGQGTFHSTVQPSSQSHFLVAGMESSMRPKPTVLDPQSDVDLVVSGALESEPREPTLFKPSPPHLRALIERLERAGNNPGAETVRVHLKSFPLAWAEAQELHDALWDLRTRGKSVDVYLGNSDFKDYYIASAGNHIYVEQGSQLDLTGLRFSRHFLKGTLDKLGVEAEIFARGKYKSAPEMFTRKSSSAPVRDADLAALRGIEIRLIEDLKKTKRVKDSSQWARILNMGLYTPKDAIEEKLVDAIAAFPTDEPEADYGAQVYRRDLTLPSRIAIIHAVGPIMSSPRGGLSLGGGGVITAEGMRKKIDRAVNDPRTLAIVLRVNSGGGEILPSYKIGRMVEEARLKKPVVVSMGGAAASGGYLISAPANHIVAQPATLTGSIGVFVGKPNLAKLYEKIDLHKEILTFAPHGGLYSWHRGFDEGGRKVMVRLLDNYYEGFVDYVAGHRKKKHQAIQSAAQGRVWFGFQAVKQGLVDELGGYDKAVQVAAKLAGLSNYETWNVTEPIGFFEIDPISLVFGTPQLKTLEPLAKLEHWAQLLESSPFLFYSPTELN